MRPRPPCLILAQQWKVTGTVIANVHIWLPSPGSIHQDPLQVVVWANPGFLRSTGKCLADEPTSCLALRGPHKPGGARMASQPASLEVCSVLPRPESRCCLECVCFWDKPWILPNCTSGGCLSVHALLLVARFLQHDHNWKQISEPRLYTCGLDSDCALLL